MTEREVFLAAIEIADPAARAAFLKKACGEDADLHARVEALLHSHEATGSFLNHPAVPLLDPGFAPTQELDHRGHAREYSESDQEALAFLTKSARADSLGRLGHYEVLEILGQGGFGIVFRAFDEVLQRVVAVKVMAPQMAATSPARKRFLREARSSAKVRHENVVQVYAVQEQPLPYLVMEFIPGETLQQRLDRTGPLEVKEIVAIGRQVAEGLAAAHDQGLIHRDIKPGNVLIESSPQARAKITDFGLARAADDASLTQSGVVAGTPMFMSPEQAKGESLDHRADLFSLGSLLYTMCCGRPPFRASSTLAVLKRVAEDNPRPIREIIPETPQWLCDIISKLHTKNPEERFQSAREVANVLADCETKFEANAKLKEFARIPIRKAKGWGPKKWIAVAATGFLCSILALMVTESTGLTKLFQSQQPPSPLGNQGQEQPPQQMVEDLRKDLPKDAVLLMTFDQKTFYKENGKTIVRDLSGNGNDGWCDKVAFTPDGRVGGGLLCQGGFLLLAQTLIDRQPNFTITGWCRVTRVHSEFPFYRTANSANPQQSVFSLDVDPNNALQVQAWNEKSEGKWKKAATAPDAVTPEWVFIAVVMSGGDKDKGDLRIVIGDKTFHRPSQKVESATDHNDMIGCFLDGAIVDEIAVFQRALSDIEIAALRNLGQSNVSLAPSIASNAPSPSSPPPAISPAITADYTGIPPKPIVATFSVHPRIYSPDGKWLVVQDNLDRQGIELRVLEVATGDLKATVQKAPQSVLGPVFSPDGSLLAVVETEEGKTFLTLLESGSFQIRKRWQIPDPNQLLAFNRTGKVIAAPAPNGQIILWNVDTGEEIDRLTELKSPHALAFSPTQDLLAIEEAVFSSDRGGRWGLDSQIVLFDMNPKSPKYKKKIRTWDAPDNGFCHTIRFTPDGSRIIFGRQHGDQICTAIADVKYGKIIHHLITPGPIAHLILGPVLPDGKTLVTLQGSQFSQVYLWDLDKGTQIHTFAIPAMGGRASLACDPTGKMMCLGGVNHSEMQFYEIATGNKRIPAYPPLTEEEIQRIAALSAAEQVEEVRKELKKRNYKFQGEFTALIENDKVVEVQLKDSTLADISPIRAFPELQRLSCWNLAQGQFNDLSVLKGLSLKSLELQHNPKLTDLKPLEGMPLESLMLWGWGGDDLTPLNGLPLKWLNVGLNKNNLDLKQIADLKLEFLCLNLTPISDIGPLQNMPLKSFHCANTRVSDLAPLKGMKLEELMLNNTKVSDLSPLKGMPLTLLEIKGTEVADFSLLKDMPLKILDCNFRLERDDSLLRSIKTLETINGQPAAEFWKSIAKSKGIVTPLSEAELKRISALPAAQQVEEVSKELKNRNPDFDGLLKPTIEQDVVTKLEFTMDKISDLAPVRAFTGLKVFYCTGKAEAVADISPLKGLDLSVLGISYSSIADLKALEGMKLTHLDLTSANKVADLSPLKGMPLKILAIPYSQVKDLSPLLGMELEILNVGSTNVSDLTPLKVMPLKRINLVKTPVGNLSPLQGMKLEYLDISETKVTDLSPLQGMKLTHLSCDNIGAPDLTVLKGMPLVELNCRGYDLKMQKNREIVQSLKDLTMINGIPTEQFWKELDQK